MPEEPPLDFERIYDAYSGRVRSYAARLIGPDEAEEVANEAFVKIARSLKTLSDPSRLASWIYAITLNTVRDAAKARAVRLRHLADAPPAASHEDDGEGQMPEIPDPRARTPEEALARSEMLACYLDFVHQLPPDYQEVYVLSEFEELTAAELAERLSLPVSTVKMRLHRARAKLYDELRLHCRCYRNERGELMGEPKRKSGPDV